MSYLQADFLSKFKKRDYLNCVFCLIVITAALSGKMNIFLNVSELLVMCDRSVKQHCGCCFCAWHVSGWIMDEVLTWPRGCAQAVRGGQRSEGVVPTRGLVPVPVALWDWVLWLCRLNSVSTGALWLFGGKFAVTKQHCSFKKKGDLHSVGQLQNSWLMHIRGCRIFTHALRTTTFQWVT